MKSIFYSIYISVQNNHFYMDDGCVFYVGISNFNINEKLYPKFKQKITKYNWLFSG